MQTAPGPCRLEDRANNFTAMRIGFAVLLLYGHALMLPQGLPTTGACAPVWTVCSRCAAPARFRAEPRSVTRLRL